ncbi:saccharopine dehydrogenase family protein [Myxosarcina sp. GI1]|uniref:saccharopine dehydrogenase family protein n=1 Tax=Myxosarcina sp. GI1 TaxID=1541065 RepID=UPI00056C4907|nr:saccharopine dehydrogenase NADP-binding domain-containing protein [Myxosarcina sp. GI1]
MTAKVLVIGGCGRIGNMVARDIVTHTNATVIVTSRSHQTVKPPFELQILDIADTEKLTEAIASVDLVVHCAGPFRHRDGKVLKIAIDRGVNYLDVSDRSSFYRQVITEHERAKERGVTAILNTGIFPGISNSMVRQGVEQFEQPQKIHLSYIVAGSGGAGLTVMRTTFLGLKEKFKALINGEWRETLPYTEREVIEFPPPHGKAGVYWFEMPETYTFADSFPVDTVITKFGSVPDLYNHLTWITAHIFPSPWVESPKGVEFFSRVSYLMTAVSDKLSGIGVAMRAEITGIEGGKTKTHCLTMVHDNTAIAAGIGTGTVAELVLSGRLKQPGVYPVEQALPTDLFIEAMNSRNVAIDIV